MCILHVKRNRFEQIKYKIFSYLYKFYLSTSPRIIPRNLCIKLINTLINQIIYKIKFPLLIQGYVFHLNYSRGAKKMGTLKSVIKKGNVRNNESKIHFSFEFIIILLYW